MANRAETLARSSFTKAKEAARMPLFRNGYALMLSATTTSGLGVIYWVLAARYYTPTAVGFNSAVISAVMFLSGISQLGLTSAMVRFIPRGGRATAKLVAGAYGVSLLTGALAGGIFVVGAGIWSPELASIGSDWSQAAWFVAATMAWSIFTLQDNVLAGLKQSIWVPIENTIFAAVKIGLLALYARSSPDFGIFASWTVPIIISLIPINISIFWRWIPKHVEATRSQAQPLELRQITHYLGSNYLGLLFSLASTTLLPVLVTVKAGAEANAYFYLPWMIAGSLQLLATNLTTSLTVEAAGDPTKLGVYSYHVLRHMLRLFTPIVLVAVLGAPLILQVFGEQYVEGGTTLLRLLALAAIPSAVNALYLSITRVQQHVVGMVVYQGVQCILTLGLGYILLDMYGIIGVGYAWLISKTIVAAFLLATSLRPILSNGYQVSKEESFK